MEVIQVSLERK